MRAVQELVGHGGQAMTTRYSHLSPAASDTRCRRNASSGICLWPAPANAIHGHSPWYSQWRCDAISAPDAKALHS